MEQYYFYCENCKKETLHKLSDKDDTIQVCHQCRNESGAVPMPHDACGEDLLRAIGEAWERSSGDKLCLP